MKGGVHTCTGSQGFHNYETFSAGVPLVFSGGQNVLNWIFLHEILSPRWSSSLHSQSIFLVPQSPPEGQWLAVSIQVYAICNLITVLYSTLLFNFVNFCRKNSPIRAFAWHPHVAKFVLAWQVCVKRIKFCTLLYKCFYLYFISNFVLGTINEEL